MFNLFPFLFILFFINISYSYSCIDNDYIEDSKLNWKSYYYDVNPIDSAKKWYLPFEISNRSDSKNLIIISTFGSPRNSYIKGHIHTGLDCKPKSFKKSVDVYSMSSGVVCSIHLDHPHRTVVVKHKTEDGIIIFTSYKHLAEIYVKTGDMVNHNTKLARFYTRSETKKYRGRYDHLHLEIRKDFGDFGPASWATMTLTELNCRFYDPLDFIRKNVGR